MESFQSPPPIYRLIITIQRNLKMNWKRLFVFKLFLPVLLKQIILFKIFYFGEFLCLLLLLSISRVEMRNKVVFPHYEKSSTPHFPNYSCNSPRSMVIQDVPILLKIYYEQVQLNLNKCICNKFSFKKNKCLLLTINVYLLKAICSGQEHFLRVKNRPLEGATIYVNSHA